MKNDSRQIKENLDNWDDATHIGTKGETKNCRMYTMSNQAENIKIFVMLESFSYSNISMCTEIHH